MLQMLRVALNVNEPHLETNAPNMIGSGSVIFNALITWRIYLMFNAIVILLLYFTKFQVILHLRRLRKDLCELDKCCNASEGVTI